MKVISTIDYKNILTAGEEYLVIQTEKSFFTGGLYGYQIIADNGEIIWLGADEGYVPVKVKADKIPWRKILKAKLRKIVKSK